MKLFEVEGGGHVPQCPIASDATAYNCNLSHILQIRSHDAQF